VTEDERTVRFLVSKGFDPEVIAGLRLARALPRSTPLPRWAHFLGHPWTEHWPLVFPVYGPSGRMESLRARWVEPEPPERPLEKAAAAACGPGSATGLALCNAGARDLLRGIRVIDPGEPIIIVEGETDFLTWALKPSVIAGNSIVFGLWSGSWTPEIADRIPDGAVIALRSDNDDAGDNYARRVQETLGQRCFIRRKQPVEAP
jgi:5S rRNA maturation endonuclease (ribonuclease M5)